MFVHIQENRGARFGESSLVFVVHALLFFDGGIVGKVYEALEDGECSKMRWKTNIHRKE